MQMCQECDGTGFVGTWIGHGGNERLGGTMRCEACGGSGGIDDESAS